MFINKIVAVVILLTMSSYALQQEVEDSMYTGDVEIHNITIDTTYGDSNIVLRDGHIRIAKYVPEYNADIYDPTGYNYSETHDDSLKFRSSDRYVKVAGTHEIYYKGRKYVKTDDSIQIPAITGNWIVYYDSTITMRVTQDLQPYYLPWVAYVYWNNTQGIGICGDERHRAVMPWKSHEEFHQTVGAYWRTGLALTAGDASFSLDAGAIKDEDITHQHGAQTSCNLFYYDGSATFTIDTGNTTLYKGTVGSLYYNDGTTLTAAPANSYMAIFLFGTNDISGRPISVIGQRTDVLLADAEDNNTLSSLSLSGFPINEYVLLYIVFYRNDATPFEKAVDYRSSSVSTGGGGSGANDHAALSNLEWSVSGHYGKVDSASLSDSSKNSALLQGQPKSYYDTLKNGILSTKLNYSDTAGLMGKGSQVNWNHAFDGFNSTSRGAPAGDSALGFCITWPYNTGMRFQLVERNNIMYFRGMENSSWGAWKQVWDGYSLDTSKLAYKNSYNIDWNLMKNGFNGNGTNGPASSYGWGWSTAWGGNQNHRYQCAGYVDKMYSRGMSAGVWGDWRLVWDEHTLDTSVFAMDNDLALKLNISDTSAFARDADVALKLNIADTSRLMSKGGLMSWNDLIDGFNGWGVGGPPGGGLGFSISYPQNPQVRFQASGRKDKMYFRTMENSLFGAWRMVWDEHTLDTSAFARDVDLALKLNISDTSVFARDADLALKLNITDTSIFARDADVDLKLNKSNFDDSLNANIGSDSYHQMASGSKLVNSNIATIGSEAIVYGDLLVTSTTNFNTGEFATQGLYANRLKMNTGHTSYGNAKANSIEFLESGTFRAGVGVPTSGTYDRALCLTAGSAMDETPEAFVKDGVFGFGSTVISNTGSTTDGLKFDGSNYLTLYNGSSGGSKDSRARFTLEDNLSLAFQFLSPSTTEQSILFGSNLDTDDGAIRYNLYDHKFTFRAKGADGVVINYNNEIGLNSNYINNNGTSDRGLTFDNNHKGYFTDGLDVTKKARIDSVDVNYMTVDTIAITEVTSPCTLYDATFGNVDIDVARKVTIGNMVKVFIPRLDAALLNGGGEISVKFSAGFLPTGYSSQTFFQVFTWSVNSSLFEHRVYLYGGENKITYTTNAFGGGNFGPIIAYASIFEYYKN